MDNFGQCMIASFSNSICVKTLLRPTMGKDDKDDRELTAVFSMTDL